jgi:hypothetical protein
MIVVFQSCAAGFVNMLESNFDDTSGAAGAVLAVMMLIGGIVGITTRNSKGGGITAGVFYLVGGIIGITSLGTFTDLIVWSILSLAFSLLFIAGSVERISSKIIWTALILVLCITTVMLPNMDLDSINFDSPFVTPEPLPVGAETPPPAATSTPSPATSSVTVTERLLFDQERVKVTLLSLEVSSRGRTELNLLIENDSDDSITVQVRDVSVNGLMFRSTIFSSNVTSGHKRNDSISFQSQGFERNGITEIGTIELSFRVINNNNRDHSFNTDLIVINTSAVNDVVQTLPQPREVLFEQDGISVSYLGLSKERSSIDVVFLITNDSEKDITVQARDESVNGFMISGTMSSDILPGKASIDTLSFSDRRLGENGISSLDEINTIEFYLRIINNDDRRSSIDTDVIQLLP